MTPPCPLHTLPVGRCGTILSIDAPAELAARMRALGLQPGRRIKVIRRSPFQGPIQVRAGQTDLMIRRAEAAIIQMQPCPEVECV
ncbi:MAG: ferrous iron transport protein A [Thiobacillaceae bacterium]|jgi:ferrous iron transport protein A|nr:ferrous iron transport protein A [Hydrogenophilales bacterium]MBP9916866.1 ferrous iron transport protein A [Thiobacillaceae bacterium]